MEFILNNKKFLINNKELFINYLLVHAYFNKGYSKYDYDISFDFIEPLFDEEEISFEDIMEGTEELEELIEKEEISFIPSGITIDPEANGSYRITYYDLEFANVKDGEAIPLLIVLNSLLSHDPIITLAQIEEETDHFLEKFRSYSSYDSSSP